MIFVFYLQTLGHWLFIVLVEKLKKTKSDDIVSLLRDTDVVAFILLVLEEGEEFEGVYETINNISLHVSESSFRPFFMKLYQWAISTSTQQRTDDGHRLLIFYQIVHCLTDALKNLFTIFASTVIGHALKLMEQVHFKKGLEKLGLEDDVRENILFNIYKIFAKFFQFDNKGTFIVGFSRLILRSYLLETAKSDCSSEFGSIRFSQGLKFL